MVNHLFYFLSLGFAAYGAGINNYRQLFPVHKSLNRPLGVVNQGSNQGEFTSVHIGAGGKGSELPGVE